MKVLHVLDHSLPLHSGYTFRSASILAEQQALGLEVAAATGPKQGEVEEATINGIRYFRSPSVSRLLARLPVLDQLEVVLSLARRLDQLISSEQPDLLHAHSPCLNVLAAWWVSRRSGLPFVYEMRASWEDAAVSHGTTQEGSLRYRLSRLLETRVLRAASAVTTICVGLREEIISRGVAKSRVTLIPNAVELSRFGAPVTADPALRSRLRGDATAVLGFIGSFYAYEGLEDLVAAMPRLLAAIPGIRLVLVGGGEVEAALARQVSELGLHDHVLMTGRVPHDEVTSYYEAMDVMVYPRRVMRLTELTTPLKPLEAMALKCVVVATDIGGHRELVTHERTGLLYQPSDVDGLIAAVQAALQPDIAARLRSNGRDFVEAERSWAAVAAGYPPVYQALLAGRACAGASL
jgi:PEP-CTERM/exosortase A-associated glycosyltransferase